MLALPPALTHTHMHTYPCVVAPQSSGCDSEPELCGPSVMETLPACMCCAAVCDLNVSVLWSDRTWSLVLWSSADLVDHLHFLEVSFRSPNEEFSNQWFAPCPSPLALDGVLFSMCPFLGVRVGVKWVPAGMVHAGTLPPSPPQMLLLECGMQVRFLLDIYRAACAFQTGPCFLFVPPSCFP